jgi:hypothetical protein
MLRGYLIGGTRDRVRDMGVDDLTSHEFALSEILSSLALHALTMRGGVS